MKAAFIFFAGIFLFVSSGFSQNADCKVLKKEISENYIGECKKGLAHGKGKAYGIDTYEGDFKKGLPQGNGTYIWKNGEMYEGEWKNGMRHGLGIYYFKAGVKETALSGKWVNDEFVKETSLVKPYKITYKNNIGRMSVTRLGNGNIIRLKFNRNGRIQTPANVNLFSANGTVEVTPSLTGFKNVTFPMEGSVKFSAMNDFNAAMINSELKFEINESGSWEIIISY